MDRPSSLPPTTGRPLGVGIIGYGMAATTFHIPLVRTEQRRTGRLALTAIASQRPDVVRRDHPDLVVVRGVPELLDLDDIDVVVVAGKNADHFSHAHAALLAGKHVVVEKPITVTTDQADQLLAISSKRNLVLAAFHNRRWDNGTLELERLLHDGALGDVARCALHFDRFSPEPRVRWREDGSPGSGMTYDLGSHLFYAALTLFGRPDWLSADIQVQRQGSGVDDCFDITMAYGTNRVSVRSTMLAPAGNLVIEAHGSAGSFLKYGADPQEGLLRAGHVPGDAAWDHYEGDDYAMVSTASMTDEERHVATERVALEPGTYEAFYAGIADAVIDGAAAPIPMHRARNVIALIEASFRSAQQGCRVPLEGLLLTDEHGRA